MTSRSVVNIRVLAIASAVAFSPLSASDAQAQRPSGAVGGTAGRERAAAERRLGETFGAIVRRQLELTDGQARQLQEVSGQYDERRRALLRQERRARTELRRELNAGDRARDAVVAAQLDTLFAVQRNRIQLVESEQRDLARFLTPVQRARYMALQENVRRRVEQGAAAGRGRQGTARPRGQAPPR